MPAETNETTTAEQPLAELAAAEQKIDQPAPAEAPVDPAEVTAAQRLKAFEDEHFGPQVVRINGRIERGFGSPFMVMPDEFKRQYAAIEHLIETEQNLADAHAALIAADTAHDEALAAAEPRTDAATAK